MKKVDENFRDDYSRILPVFKYGNKEIATSIGSEMDLTIKKSSKLITLHSIKAKPKVTKGRRMTAEEKEYYNKNEFNKWVDDLRKGAAIEIKQAGGKVEVEKKSDAQPKP